MATPGHEISLALHKKVLSLLAAQLKPLGFRRTGVSFWKSIDDPSRFAGFVASVTPLYATKKVEFQVVTMGGWEQLHPLLWSSWEKPKLFTPGWDCAQFRHHLVDPRGEGFVGKVWNLWPSTDLDEFWPQFWGRIENEGLPAVDTMLDHQALLAALESEAAGGEIYIRAKSDYYCRTAEIIRTLRDAA